MEKLRFLDLFSGIGAYSLGLRRAGMTCVAHVEIDPWCQGLLRQNFPETPVLGDVQDVDFASIQADVIIGGFPCQDISNAGKRAGLAGERSGLFWEMVRAIRVVRPVLVIVENVASLLDRDRGMGVVLGTLAEDGYDSEWDCISLDQLGAPHGRERVWIAATNPHSRKRENGGCASVRWWERGSKEGGATASDRDDTDLGEGAAIPLQGRQRIRGSGETTPANTDSQWQPQPPRIISQVRRWIDNGDAGAFWASDWQAKFETLRGMDVRPPTRLDRTRDSAAIGHLGNCNPPQIPELIGRAWLEASA
jgi:site-specific DNA-cytosine methylase